MLDNFFCRIFNTSNPNKTAIISRGEKYSYLDFRVNVLGLSKTLARYSGQTIAIYIDDSPMYIFLFWSCILNHIQTVLINKNSPIEHIKHIVIESKASYLVSDVELSLDFCKTLSLEKLKNYNISNDTSCLNPFTKEETAFFLCTSGSTGNPKCVPRTLEDIEFCATTFNNTDVKLNSSDLVYSVSKIPFAFGFGNIMYLPFFMSCTVFVSNTSDLVCILKNIEEIKPTVLFGVPTVYNGLLNLLGENEIKNRLRMTISCGEVLPKVIGRQWENKMHLPLLEGMGTTEFLYTFLINTPNNNRYGSTGQLIEGFEADIVNDNFRKANVGEIGNLYVKGNSITKGYINGRDTSAFIKDGMLTGDLFFKDKDEFFWYVGRRNSIFKLNGKWVKAEDIENELLKVPFIKEAMVRAEYNSDSITFLSAYIVLESKKTITCVTSRKLKSLLRKKVPHSNVPDHYFVVDSLPKGVTGKLDRKFIKNRKEIK